ncbi:MAG TPA: HigA family addiction module antidote protein [Rhodospirillaceae bacterium]|nr:HigA family addiction module antidote protein [Rhodospirillaceae bacterium]
MTSPVNGLPPIHPGEMLADELAELGLSARALAGKLKVPHNRISAILAGRRSVSADTSLRLGRFFGMSEDFWLRLQTTYDIKRAKAESGAKITSDVLPLHRDAEDTIWSGQR